MQNEFAAEWRGLKEYLMTNAQMAEAVKDGAPTVAALKKIDGFGKARMSKYGERLCCFAGPREGGAEQ